MIRDITIGQYYQTDSVIHRLDPRVKLAGTLLYIVTLFFIQNMWGYLLATAALAAVIKLSKVPLGFIVRGMKAIAFPNQSALPVHMHSRVVPKRIPNDTLSEVHPILPIGKELRFLCSHTSASVPIRL